MSFKFGTREIGSGKPVFIISEIGVNHEGDFDVCRRMVDESAKAGADAIKLQTVDPDENYVKGNPSWELFRTCILTKNQTAEMFQQAESLGMEAFTTSPDTYTLDWVDALGVPGHKISSGMMTNDVILKHTCAKNKPVLISTGMATAEQMDHAISVAKATGNRDIAIFQCTSEYPAASESLNLSTMAWMAKRYNLPVGFSDHSKGIDAAIVATTLGAVMIEKHFTLDVTRASFDHRLSLEPDDFRRMVDEIRAAQEKSYDEVLKVVPEAAVMMGEPERHLSETLQQRAAGNLRCLVARQPIKRGDVLTVENVGLKRPFSDRRGLEPVYYERVMGQEALADLRRPWRGRSRSRAQADRRGARMKKSITILMTCTGGDLAPEYLLAMKNSSRYDVTMIAVDGNPDAIGRHFADAFYVVPMGGADDYISTMKSIVQKHKVDLIIVGSDGEALSLTANREIFESAGCKIACPSANILKELSNKASTYTRLQQAGVDCAKFHSVDNLSDLQSAVENLHAEFGELVVKPAISRGGRNVFVIRNDLEEEQSYHGGRETHCPLDVFQKKYQKAAASLFPLVVMQRLHEPTYDIDVLSWEGKPINIVPRKRHNPAGIPFDGNTICLDENLVKLGKKVAEVFNLSWLLDVDVMCTKDGTPVVLEVNPRMSGSCPASVHAGVPLFDNIIALALGDIPVAGNAKDGTIVLSHKSLRKVA